MLKAKIKQRLLTKILAETTVHRGSIHALSHWKRVERNGLYLAQFNDANKDVIQYFAFLHDCRRLHDGHDEGHGKRAADYARKIRSDFIDLSDDDFELLYYCCSWHTKGRVADNDTISCCWDADRLDLTRLAMEPNSRFLFTDQAKSMADKSDFRNLEKFNI